MGIPLKMTFTFDKKGNVTVKSKEEISFKELAKVREMARRLKDATH